MNSKGIHIQKGRSELMEMPSGYNVSPLICPEVKSNETYKMIGCTE